jgi:Cu-Zn family superoxide dismutase
MRRSALLGFGVLVSWLSIGCGSIEDPSSVAEQQTQELHTIAVATLRDAAGTVVGRATFVPTGAATTVGVAARFSAALAGFHGMHVHANDNPANGSGCVADPTQPANTHFVAVDGHYNPTASTHGDHAGDMPALLVTDTGAAATSFLIDSFAVADIRGRALIVHQNADNYGNVPVGTAPNQYTANSQEALTLTQNTGNAGNRIACGIIE